MNRIFSIFIICALGFALSACTAEQIPFVYKIDIPQGNIVTDEQLAKLKPGMPPEHVNFLLGTPLLVDPFHQNQWEYIYQFEPGSVKKRKGEKPEEELLRIYFAEGVVERFTFVEREADKKVKEVEAKPEK